MLDNLFNVIHKFELKLLGYDSAEFIFSNQADFKQVQQWVEKAEQMMSELKELKQSLCEREETINKIQSRLNETISIVKIGECEAEKHEQILL